MTNMLLRCSKCGSHTGFLVETQGGQTLEVKTISTDRIKKTVLVTCLYCNNRWDHVPISITDRRLEEPLSRKVTH